MRGRGVWGLEPLLFSHSELPLTFLNVRFRPEADIQLDLDTDILNVCFRESSHSSAPMLLYELLKFWGIPNVIEAWIRKQPSDRSVSPA